MTFNPSGPAGSSFPRPRFQRDRDQYNKHSSDEHRINERIRVPEVRLIGDKGEQHGIVKTVDALRMARDKGLDLMEVAPNAKPPVCKLIDYGKYKYQQKKKEHEAKKKQTVIKVKEVQLRPNTDEHDLDYKFRAVRTFLEEGDKAKITVMFRGREVAYTEHAMGVMKNLIELMKDVGAVESPPKMEGRKLIMILTPVKIDGKKVPPPPKITLPVGNIAAVKKPTP